MSIDAMTTGKTSLRMLPFSPPRTSPSAANHWSLVIGH